MSRIGREPIAVPAGVTITIADGNVVTVKGPLGELTQTFNRALTIAQENGQGSNVAKTFSQVYLKKAQADNKAKNYEAALENCMKSNEYTESANAYRLAATVSQKLNKTQDVIAYYEKYLELSPNAKDFAGVAYTIAVLSQQEGDKAKAKEYYEKITADPQYGAAAQEYLKNN